MNTKQYERLLSIVMEKLEQSETEKNWLKYENNQLKDKVEKLTHKEDVKQVMSKIKSQIQTQQKQTKE